MLHRYDFAAAEEQYESLAQQLEAAGEEVEQYVAKQVDCTQDLDIYMRNLYSSASIKGYGYMLYLTNFVSHYTHCSLSWARLRAQRAKCLRMIRAGAQCIVDNTFATLSPLRAGKDKSPRILFDGLKMIWPLTVVHASTSASAEQRAQAYTALLSIGKEIGARQALCSYAEDLTLPLEARLPLGLELGDDATPAFL